MQTKILHFCTTRSKLRKSYGETWPGNQISRKNVTGLNTCREVSSTHSALFLPQINWKVHTGSKQPKHLENRYGKRNVDCGDHVSGSGSAGGRWSTRLSCLQSILHWEWQGISKSRTKHNVCCHPAHCRRRRGKKSGTGDSLFARLNNTTTTPTLMNILSNQKTPGKSLWKKKCGLWRSCFGFRFSWINKKKTNLYVKSKGRNTMLRPELASFV